MVGAGKLLQMDAATAKMVDATMADVFREATVLTVAHRLPSVLEHCERVVVMSEGRVVEQGKPRYVERLSIGYEARDDFVWFLLPF